jgi:hypothetical protein
LTIIQDEIVQETLRTIQVETSKNESFRQKKKKFEKWIPICTNSGPSYRIVIKKKEAK